MTNRKHNLPLVQQCKALKVHRTTIYRESKPVNQDQLDLMKLIDRIHVDDPAWGCRKVREYLIELGHPIKELSFPSRHLVGMNFKLLRNRFVTPKSGNSHLSLERC